MPLTPNPFTPNRPIDPEYFAGRVEELIKVESALNQTKTGRTQHLLLTGERGIGKSSLALYARWLASEPREIRGNDFAFASAYYTVEQGQNLADVCRGLVSKLLRSIDRSIASVCLEKCRKLKLHFQVNVPGVGELGVESGRSTTATDSVSAEFAKAVEECWDEIKRKHNGILLIIDELHNLGSFTGLGGFFKVVSEAWAVDGYPQLMFMGVGLPPVPSHISEDDYSAPRIFTYVELQRMTEDESLAILNKCLNTTGVKIEPEAAKWIARRSGGFPYFLHQLGYDAFQEAGSDTIDMDASNRGLIRSLVQFDRMFFGKIYKSIEGTQKQKIVDAMAEKGNNPITAAQLGTALRIKNIHQYLKPLEKDGILEKIDRHSYKLSSDLLAIYVLLFKTTPRAVRAAAEKQSASQAGTTN